MPEKAGHGGTLDPLASGLLPIALGEATKTVSWAMDGQKTYRFTVRWGEERTTDDREGEVSATSGERPVDRRRSKSILAALHRRHSADSAGLLGHQGRRRAGL